MTLRDNAGFSREEIINYLESKQIQTRMLFAGNIIKHPCFDEMRENKTEYRVIGGLKNTDKIMKDTFWIGVYPGLTEEAIEYVVKTIKEFTSAGKKGI